MRYFVELFIVGFLSVAFFGFSANAQIINGWHDTHLCPPQHRN